MNTSKLDAVKTECARRRANVSAGNYETGQLRIARLLGWLMRPNPTRDNNGNVKESMTVRQYLIRYDREKYLDTLLGIQSNRHTYGVEPRGLNNTYSYASRDTFKVVDIETKYTVKLKCGMLITVICGPSKIKAEAKKLAAVWNSTILTIK